MLGFNKIVIWFHISDTMCQKGMEEKMSKKVLVMIGAIFLISTLAFVGVLAFKASDNGQGINYSSEVHDQLEAAIAKGDYDAWLKIRQDNDLPTIGNMFRTINKENFNIYVELHNANLAGDTPKADAIRSELGLGNAKMIGKAPGKMKSATDQPCGGCGTHAYSGFSDSNQDGICDNYPFHNRG
jgi:hypothetical protein